MGLVALSKVDDAKAKSTSNKYFLHLCLLSEVDVENWPALATSKKATISANIPFIQTATSKWVRLDCNVKAMKPNCQPGESPYGGKLTLTPVIDGITDDTIGWIRENQGKQFLVVWTRCADGQKFLGGSPCSNGMTLKFTSIGAQDGVTGIAITFEGEECFEPFYFYDGSVANPYPVVGGGE